MNIKIRTTNLEITAAIEEYIRKKIKTFERPISCFSPSQEGVDKNLVDAKKENIELLWEIANEAPGTNKKLFSSKCKIGILGNKDIIARVTSSDLYEAIDETKDIIISQIVDRKEKPISLKRKVS